MTNSRLLASIGQVVSPGACRAPVSAVGVQFPLDAIKDQFWSEVFMDNNARKAKVLGMPFGTASAKLRKALLFDLSKRLGLHQCFRCGKPIETIAEFSIEHKQSWLNADNPQEAFFDVENIAFSHISCNVGHGTRMPRRDQCIRGHPLSRRITGQGYCRVCETERMRQVRMSM